MTEKSTRLAAAVALVALAFASSCTRDEQTLVAPEPLPSVKVAFRTHLSYSPLIIAYEDGFFQEEGVDVEVIDLGSADSMVALGTGEVDVVGIPLFVGLFNAMARGSSIRIVADKGHVDSGCSPYTMMAREGLFGDGPLSVDDVRGRKLELRGGSIFDYITERFLEMHELSRADFEQIEYVIPSSSVAAFTTDQLDLKIEAEPNQSFLIEKGLARPWIPLNDIIQGSQFAVIVYGKRLVEDDPELGVKFMKGYLRGIRRYNEGSTDRNVEIISNFTSLAPDLVRTACWAPVHSDGRVNRDQTQDFVDWAFRKGLLDAPVGESEWWDPRFIEQAAAANLDSRSR